MSRACLGPDPNTRQPQTRVPAHACDCHAHVFGPDDVYPYVEDRTFTPPAATVQSYLKMLDAIGFERGVLVQSGTHGLDNRVTLNAVSSNKKRLRGVAVVGPDTPVEQIRELHLNGFRGTRLSTVIKGTPSFDTLAAICKKIEPFGWHVVVHVDKSAELVALAPRLAETGVGIVVDHIGRVRLEEGIQSPGFKALLQLLATDRCWVKLSGQHRMSREAYPWSDMGELVEAVVKARPDRALWGTDWPHPNQYDAMQNDGDLVDALAKWVPDPALQKQILVDNPANLYQFD